MANNKAIVIRLVLQKLMASGAFNKYISPNKKQEISNLFLLMDERELTEKCSRMSLPFIASHKQGNYYQPPICEMMLIWSLIKDELQDGEGNLWRSEKLGIKLSTNSTYSTSVEEFNERVDCLLLVRELCDSIAHMTSDPIATLTHNNEERIEKEKKDLYDRSCNSIAELIERYTHMKKNMRIGSVKWLPATTFASLSLQPNVYRIKFQEGSKSRPRYKFYSLFVGTSSSNYKFIRTQG